MKSSSIDAMLLGVEGAYEGDFGSLTLMGVD